LVQGKMGQLMTESLGEIADVGPEENRVRLRQRNGGAPRWRTAGRERIQMTRIGHDDETQRTRIDRSQPWPLRGSAGKDGELAGDSKLRRPCDDRHLTYDQYAGLLGRGRPEREEEY
jgi:hypothetical protein